MPKSLLFMTVLEVLSAERVVAQADQAKPPQPSVPPLLQTPATTPTPKAPPKPLIRRNIKGPLRTVPKASATSAVEPNILTPPNLSSRWYASAAEITAMTASPSLGLSGQLQSGTTTGSEGPTSYQLRATDNSLDTAVLSPLAGTKVSLAAQFYRRWHTELLQIPDFPTTTGYLNTAADYAIAYEFSDTFSLGIAYEYSVDTYRDSTFGDVTLAMGVYGLAGHWTAASQDWTLDFGAKSGAHAFKNEANGNLDSRPYYKYLPPELFGKFGYRLTTDFALGVVLKYYDYARKNNQFNIFYNDSMNNADRWASALMAAYRPAKDLTMRVFYEHSPSAEKDHIDGSPSGIVTTDGISADIAFAIIKAFTVGATAGFDRGNRDYSSAADPNNTATETVEYGALWVAVSM